jgi:hypothetical protein
MRDNLFLIFSPMKLLIVASKIDVPFNLTMDYGVLSILFKGWTVETSEGNIMGGIKVCPNSLILSLRVIFFSSISSTDSSREFLVDL